jgi:hypothetical protein
MSVVLLSTYHDDEYSACDGISFLPGVHYLTGSFFYDFPARTDQAQQTGLPIFSSHLAFCDNTDGVATLKDLKELPDQTSVRSTLETLLALFRLVLVLVMRYLRVWSHKSPSNKGKTG